MAKKRVAGPWIGINVGASKDTVAEARLTIILILEADCDEETKRAALGALVEVCSVKNATITGCSISQGNKV